MADDQSSAPILDALAQYSQSGSISFEVPGHKSGRGAMADALIAAIRALATWAENRPASERRGRPPGMPQRRELRTVMEMTPAEAFFAKVKHVPLERAAGRVAAEMVTPYPPGIPRLVPGQPIDEAHVAFLRLGLEAGLFPLGTSDQSLKTLRVVA
jgi:arginine/lysine/ornithine decarboxylase